MKVVISAVKGAGKSTAIKFVRERRKDIEVVSVGDFFEKEYKKRGLKRDAGDKGVSKEEHEKLQREIFEKIGEEIKKYDNVIIDTNLFFTKSEGYFPGLPEYVLKKTRADIAAIGEAEETIVELLKCKLKKGDLSQVKGIAYWDNQDVVINQRREPIWKLDSIPFPQWSLFPMERYTTCLKLFDMEEQEKALALLTSRGCINKCNFCYRMEEGIRFRSVENIIKEMKFLKENYGVTYFQIADELFIFSKKRIFDFYQALKENNLKIKFICSARVDIFDEEMAVCLKESGCTFLNFGMESSDQQVLNLMHKNTTVEQNIEAAKITKKTGIGLGLNFIWGNKGDSEKSLRDNVSLIKEYNTYDQIRTIRPVTPYPGSELYYEAVERGLLAGPDDFFNRFKNSDLLTVNFTDIPEKKFYQLLFEANKELINDYFEHTTKDVNRANELIKGFFDLYFKNKIDFRGARQYHKSI